MTNLYLLAILIKIKVVFGEKLQFQGTIFEFMVHIIQELYGMILEAFKRSYHHLHNVPRKTPLGDMS